MKIHDGNGLLDGYLDYPLASGALRIRVGTMLAFHRIDDQFFSPTATLRLLLAYLREVGPRTLLRKIRSRRSERQRNDRFVSIGWGTVIEGSDPPMFEVGSRVIFFAPSHPRWLERIVVPTNFCAAAPDDEMPALTSERLAISDSPPPDNQWEKWIGWQEESGVPPSQEVSEWLVSSSEWARGKLSTARPVASIIPVRSSSVESARMSVTKFPAPQEKGLSVVGFGNYVKGVALPELSKKLSIVEVFDVDPLVLPTVKVPWGIRCGSGHDDPSKYADAVLLAGYHHTHAPIATQVLRAGKWAIVEKPVATTFGQLASLEAAAKTCGRLMVCFQRRYDLFTEMAIADLGVSLGEPISYACIVFEVPLPERHWYRWSTSGSRLISNGCHWMDHFLWLNRGVEILTIDVRRGRLGAVHTWIELVNGATFSMLLTDEGSARIGLQDNVELRHGSRTVRIRNSTSYEAESDRGIVRRAKQLRSAPYQRMYRAIAKNVSCDGRGDDLEHLIRSTRCTLQAEAALQRIPESGDFVRSGADAI